jgi:type II secretory pathway component PulM
VLRERFSRLAKWYRAKSRRERNLLTLLVLALLLFGLVKFGVEPTYAIYVGAQRDLETKTETLQHYSRLLASKERVVAEAGQVRGAAKKIEAMLIPGSTPEVAGAELQGIVKSVAQDVDLEITSISPKQPREMKSFTVIAVGFPLRCNISDLSKFLYGLEHATQLLMVSDLKIRVVGRKDDPSMLQVDMLVSGLLRSGQPKAAEDKKQPEKANRGKRNETREGGAKS